MCPSSWTASVRRRDREPGGLAREAPRRSRRAVETTAARPLSCASPKTNVRIGMKRSTSVRPRMRAAPRGRLATRATGGCGARSAGCGAASNASSGRSAASSSRAGSAEHPLHVRAHALQKPVVGVARPDPPQGDLAHVAARRRRRAAPSALGGSGRRIVIVVPCPTRLSTSHRAAVLLDDAVDDREPEARSPSPSS